MNRWILLPKIMQKRDTAILLKMQVEKSDESSYSGLQTQVRFTNGKIFAVKIFYSSKMTTLFGDI